MQFKVLGVIKKYRSWNFIFLILEKIKTGVQLSNWYL